MNAKPTPPAAGESLAALKQQVARLEEQVAAQRRGESALLAISHQYQTLVQLASDAIFTISLPDAGILEANQAASDLLGYSPEELKGMKGQEIIAPGEYAGTLQAILQQMETQGTFHLETTLVRRDGSHIPVLASGTIIRGEELSRMQIISRDITWQKQSAQALQQLETRYHQLFQAAHDVVCLVDPAGNILDMNPRGVALSGYSRRELLTMNMLDHLIMPEDRARLRPVWQHLEEGRPSLYQVRWRSRSGDTIFLEGASTPHLSSDGRLLASLCILRDVSERLKAEEELRRWAQELQVLYEVSLEINAQTDLMALLHTIVKRSANLVQTSRGSLYLMRPDGQTLELVALYGNPEIALGTTLRLGEGLTGRVAAQGEPLMVPDYAHWEGAIQPLDETASGRLLGVPLKIGQQIVGVLNFFDQQVGPFAEESVRLARLFAAQAALAIANARALEAEQAAHEQAETLRQVTLALVAHSNLDDLLSELLRQARRLVPYQAANIMLLEGGSLRVKHWAGYDEYGGEALLATLEQPLAFFADVRQAVETGQTVIIVDTEQEPDWVRLEGTEWIRSSLLLPIRLQERVVGLLRLDGDRPGLFQAADAGRLQPLVNAAAIALENARLLQAERAAHRQAEAYAAELESRERFLTILNEITTAALQTADLAGVAQTLADHMGELIGADGCYITFWDEATGQTMPAAAYGQMRQSYASLRPQPGERTMTQSVLQAGRPLVAEDVHHSPHISPRIAALFPTRSMLALPLVGDGRKLGAALIAFDRPHHFTAREIALGEQAAGQLSLALAKARLLAEIQQRAEELNAVAAVSLALRAAGTREEMAAVILDQLQALLQASNTGLILQDERTEETVVMLARGIWAGRTGERRPPGVGLGGHVIATGKSYLIHDVQASPPDPVLVRPELVEGLRALLCVPLIVQEEVIGALTVGRERPIEEQEVRLLSAIGNIAANAIHRARLFEQVQEQAEQVRLIIDTVPEGVVLLDEAQRILLANPAAQRGLATLAGAGIGQRLERLGQRPLPELLQAVPEGGPRHEVRDETEQFIFEVAARPVPFSPQQGGWVLILRDVTEERRQEAYLQTQDRLATVGQLAAGIAHDFNNIMAAITIYAQMLLQNPALSPKDQSRLNTIYQQTQRAAMLTRQVLDFSRRAVMTRTPLDLHPFLQELLSLLERTLPENVTLHLEAEAGDYLLSGDPSRLQQVIMNLALNARDAMPGGGALSFHLSHLALEEGATHPFPDMAAGRWLRLQVADTGTGISEENLGHIFEPFFTTKQPGQGTGLGLAQVYGIVMQHGGRIGVQSKEGKGTVFTIFLPASPLLAEEAPATRLVALEEGQGQTILVVEDNQAAREAVGEVLGMFGYRVMLAASGQEALRLYEAHAGEIALVVSDLVMPAMGGVELLHLLRERYAQVKMVVITGYPLEEESKQALEQGVVAWLQKPFTTEQIVSAVSRALR